jgi:hypothetical protein
MRKKKKYLKPNPQGQEKKIIKKYQMQSLRIVLQKHKKLLLVLIQKTKKTMQLQEMLKQNLQMHINY